MKKDDLREQPNIPTPKQIEERTAKIRATWTKDEWQARNGSADTKGEPAYDEEEEEEFE